MVVATVRRACKQEGTLVDLVEAVEAGPTLLRTAIHQLGRLRGVLADLSGEFGPTAVLAPEVSPARH